VEWTGIKGTILNNVSMKRYTSMKVGGPVSYLIYPRDEKDLITAIRIALEKGVRYRFLGNGTNIIVHDRGLREAVIRTTRMQQMNYERKDDSISAEVSGGTSLKGFIVDNACHGLAGLEKLYWIPGTVGGGIKMNAGSFGSRISDTLESVRLIDKSGKIVSYRKNEMGFGYRESRIGLSNVYSQPVSICGIGIRMKFRRIWTMFSTNEKRGTLWIFLPQVLYSRVLPANLRGNLLKRLA